MGTMRSREPQLVAKPRAVQVCRAHFAASRKALVDHGFKKTVVEYGQALGIEVDIVARNPEHTGFVPQPIRWRMERTFGWHMLHRRLVGDFENRPDSSSAMIHIAMIDTMLRRITHRNTPSWHEPSNLAPAA